MKPGQFINRFATLSPKSYAYVTNDDKTMVKMEGFSLKGEAKDLITFNSILHMLQTREVVVVPYFDLIWRNKKTVNSEQISTQNKKCQFNYDKRVIVDDQYNTKPYGYCS